MKKLLILLLVIALVPLHSLALSSDVERVEKATIDAIVQKSEKIELDKIVIDEESGKEYLVEKYEYTQLIDTLKSGEKHYVSQYTDVITPAKSGHYVDEWDTSLSLYFTVTVQYTTSFVGSVPTVKFTKASGSYVCYDNSVSVKSQTVKLAQVGVYINGNGNFTPENKSDLKSPNGPWSYNIPTDTWHALVKNDTRSQYALWSYTLQRQSGTNFWSGTIGADVP